MAYLFLSFCEHLDEGRKSRNELYNQSLREQFKFLQNRIPLERQSESLEDFIGQCFPTGLSKKYFLSCPNFLREKTTSTNGKSSYLNNVVVRPELTLSMNQILPDNQNIILIGDIFESEKSSVLVVKGMEFIDSSMSSPHDLPVNAQACLSFEKGKSQSRAGTLVTYKIWSIDRVNLSDSLFTPDFVYDLIQNCYTVKKPEQVRRTYEIWKQYMDFRKYYLEEQSKRNFLLDSAEFIDSYAVNKREYRKNSSIYDDYILDGSDKFKQGEMIVLKSQVEDAEPFPLIRLNIDRNKKKFNEATIFKQGRSTNEEEKRIRSLSSDNVFITQEDPNKRSKNDSESRIDFNILLDAGYILGDRFKIITFDVLPEQHLQELELQCGKDINQAYKTIDDKYAKIERDELNDVVNIFKKQGQEDIEHQVNEEQKRRDYTLEQEIIENTDAEILSKISKKKAEISTNLRRTLKRDKSENDEDYRRRLDEAIEEECSEIDVKSFYVDRNSNKINELRKSLESKLNKNVVSFEQKKKVEIENKYRENVRNEKFLEKARLDEQLKANKEQVIEDETIIRFSLYFKLNDANNNISNKQKDIIQKCKYIVYDNRAEKAKIRRQEDALNNFYSGFVKNPYLSTYLFNPEQLDSVQTNYEDWVWYLDSLNEKQKEAVRKAVSSNGVFLLQGPPGTGKTQVIAETVAHLVKKGKKVLISSETHKAIDNVFERLPKIAEIVPIRLIPSSNDKKKDNAFDPEFLVDNLYLNIATNMRKAIDRYKNFRKNKEEFSDEFAKLKLLKSKVDKSQKVLEDANKEINHLEIQSKKLNSEISSLGDKLDEFKIDLDIYRRTKRHIDNDNLRPEEDVKREIILSYRQKIQSLFVPEQFAKNVDLGDLVKNINNIKIDEIERETAVIDPKANQTILEIKRNDIKAKMASCRDDFDEVIPEKKEEYESLKKQLINVKKEIDEAGSSNFGDLKLSHIFEYAYLVENVNDIKKQVIELKQQIQKTKNEFIEKVISESEKVETGFSNYEKQIAELKTKVKHLNDSIIEIQDRDDVKDVQNSKYKLEKQLNMFFKEFEISEPYSNVDEALGIIKEKWDELEQNFTKKEAENKEKIPMYEKISRYLSKKDVIDSDRRFFTKDIFENANVFGITCTSNDRFTSNNLEAISEYSLDEINLKTIGIDVVIIDEVSKSSFIDLLIPILYGKTVILVGDHRQLPPIYEFSKLRNEDFEGLDEEIINPEINKKFTKLNEECFFKTLFEKIPDSYKTMLVQQYRCHEDIMRVFNHFYQGQLRLGWVGQNNQKQHNIKLISNGRSIIEPNKHIYFVNCKQTETRDQDSTSIYNFGEARVVAELIRKLNDYFKQNPDREKLSIGVICTYGDQAKQIKDSLRREQVKTDAFRNDAEKMIVNTVDDFQGDERDIIILSTVRNPENYAHSNPGFILAYQRINVALSRARRLLIMVGNRKYLETKGVINLPAVNGNPDNDQNNFRVYEEILSTIECYGKVIDDVDVLPNKEARVNG